MSCAAHLGDDASRAPTFHRWVEIELEKVFEGYYVDRGLVVRTNCLDASGDNDVDSGFEHRLQVASGDFFVYGCEVKAETPSSFRHDLPPAFPERSLDRENDRARRIFLKVFD